MIYGKNSFKGVAIWGTIDFYVYQGSADLDNSLTIITEAYIYT